MGPALAGSPVPRLAFPWSTQIPPGGLSRRPLPEFSRRCRPPRLPDVGKERVAYRRPAANEQKHDRLAQ